ncbi:Microcystin-dependent protein [Candidatus Terasakiella magnetica]|nr:Microcystin-dependent protein [Candidatus Terasakiella magnetica]
MSDFYLGEIRMFPYDRVPQYWHVCDGTLLQVTQNQALFSLLYNSFGGDGKTTFALPDLRGRAIACSGGQSQNTISGGIGSKGGVETVALGIAQMPPHHHTVLASSATAASSPAAGGYYAQPAQPSPVPAGMPAAPALYTASGTGTATPAPLAALNFSAVSTTGTGAGHENRQPYMAMAYCIATNGIYPPRD